MRARRRIRIKALCLERGEGPQPFASSVALPSLSADSAAQLRANVSGASHLNPIPARVASARSPLWRGID